MNRDEFKAIHDAGTEELSGIFNRYSGHKRDEVLEGADSDVCVLKPENNSLVLTNSEMMLEGVHFDLTYTPLHHLGFKLVTSGVSNILARNGKPLSISVSLALPNKISIQMIEELYKGINAAANYYGLQVTGGDTAASHQLLVLAVHATGTVASDELLSRDGSREGDVLCVTGDLGAAMAGLRILMREKKSWLESEGSAFNPELENYTYVVQRQLSPAARSSFSKALKMSEVMPTAIIDLTKGLMNDVQLLCDASNTGCELFSPAVPISIETRNVADEMKEDVDRYAFYGGEDFELLFTLEESDVEKLKTEFEDFAVIGKMTARDKGIVIHSGEEH